jgi:redox-sensitive bicupin YhaK (pirin superfamily)
MLYKRSRSQYRYQNGSFFIVPNLPGYAIPEHGDHGYGPLARFDDTTLEPGGFVPMHEHRNDEIITYITDGLVRHADSAGARLVASPTKIMVMNAGKSFWHEEGTTPDDPTLRALQIFVRPHTVDLEPNIQFREIGTPPLNEWRLLAGPENTEAPSFVRNDVPCTMLALCAVPKLLCRSGKPGTPSSMPIAAASMSTGQASKRKRAHCW